MNENTEFDTVGFQTKLIQIMKDSGYWSSSGPDYYAAAPKLNMSPVTLFRYLKGERVPTLPILVKIAQFFDVSLDWLLGVSESRDGNVVRRAPLPEDDTGKMIALIQQATPSEREVISLYMKASPNDREIVKCILAKYAEKE